MRDANRSAEPSVEGRDERGDRVFEPQDSSKGDIARVLFYMSIRWGLNITGVEEMYLRQWHNADPVSLDEQAKNDERANIQGNRNPSSIAQISWTESASLTPLQRSIRYKRYRFPSQTRNPSRYLSNARPSGTSVALECSMSDSAKRAADPPIIQGVSLHADSYSVKSSRRSRSGT